MASVNDRWHTKLSDGTQVRSSRYGTGMRWQVRYRSPDGASRNKSFERKADADRYLVAIQADVNRGLYIDPKLGRTTFDEIADRWFSGRTADSATIVQNEMHLRKYARPHWGKRAIGSIKASDIQEWLAILNSSQLSPRYIKGIFQTFRAVLTRAVDDGLLSKNPADSTRLQLPKVARKKFDVWKPEMVRAVIEAHPDRYRLIALFGAVCGLRQGEALGVRIQDIDFDSGLLHVRQQIKLIKHQPKPALPKNRKSRSVPIPEFLLDLVKQHVSKYGVLEGEQILEPCTAGLLSFSREKLPMNKNYHSVYVWRPALRHCGISVSRVNGTHALRHFCATTWLNSNVNIKAVSEYLGHSDAGFTLNTYIHVMPRNDDLARQALSQTLN